jgi:hypothetical protein
MTSRTARGFILLWTAFAVAAAGCSRSSPTEPWSTNSDPIVFDEPADFGAHQVEYQAFGGSKLDALSIDSTESYRGETSLKFYVPDPGDPSGGWAGGAFVAIYDRDLTAYNAVSFWVKASKVTTLAETGLGNDNTGTSQYTVSRFTIPMNTWWTKVIIPVPMGAKLAEERGLFYVAEGPQANAGLSFWVDDVRFVYDPTITNPRPSVTPQAVSTITGGTATIKDVTRTTFSVGGVDQTVSHMAGYFTFDSSDSSVATVTDGVIHAFAPGTSTLTARLGAVPASGVLTVSVTAPPAAPAPTPALPSSDVVSLFSNVYPGFPVESWRQFASAAPTNPQVQDIQIAGDLTKLYTGLAGGYIGAQFSRPTMGDTTMTALHLDLWVVSGTTFRVKLVDFGADGVFGGSGVNADSQSELTFNGASTPPLTTGIWIGLDIPLDRFTGLTSRAHLAQLIFSGDTPTVFVDNIYFHK